MTVSYTIEADDVLASRRWNLQRPDGKALVRREYFTGLATAVLLLSLFQLLFWSGHQEFPILIVLPVTLLGVSVVWHFYYGHALEVAGRRLLAGVGRVALGAHSMTISSEGITEERPQGSVSHRWSAVDDVGATKDHIFISVAGDGTYVVPRRALEAHVDTAFLEAVGSFRGKSDKR